jgi:hypothetical protein
MPTLLLIGQEDNLRDARKVAERMRKLLPKLIFSVARIDSWMVVFDE